MFLPDNIDFSKSNKYILSIRLTPNGFYFSIHCPTDTTIFYQKSVVFNSNETYIKHIQRLIFDYPFFSNNFFQITVISVNDKLTLIPNEFYDKREESNLLSFNYCNPTLKAMSCEIDKLECRVIWEIDESHHNFLSRNILHPIFKSHLSILISFFCRLHTKGDASLFINFNDDNMIDAIAFSGDKLKFAKTFVAINPLEESYYIQKTWEVLNMNLQADTLIFSGRTANHSNCIETLKKVIHNTKILSVNLPSDLKINQSEIPTEILSQLCV